VPHQGRHLAMLLKRSWEAAIMNFIGELNLLARDAAVQACAGTFGCVMMHPSASIACMLALASAQARS